MNLRITKQEGRKCADGWCGGVWVRGTIGNYLFDALVFEEHAENEEYEIGRSRISNLWVHDGKGIKGRTVYNWDRGLDVEAVDEPAAVAVATICGLLAERVFGKVAC